MMRGESGLTHGCVVGVGEALVYSLLHENPGVVGKRALDDLVVVLLQILGGLHREGERGTDGSVMLTFYGTLLRMCRD